MKQIILIAVTISLLIGCREKKTFQTYYGEINIDTMCVGMYYEDHSKCYIVHTENKDTFYYNPKNNIYIHQFPTNDQWGNAVVIYDPYKNE